MNANRRSILKITGLGAAAAVLANCLPKLSERRPVDLTGNPRVKIVAGTLAYRHVGGRRGPNGGNWEIHRLPDGRFLPGGHVMLINPHTGKPIVARSCDTGTGLVNIYTYLPAVGKRVYTLGRYQRIDSLEVHAEYPDFDVVHRQTGETLHRVRWV
jgi:hypothetical protein